MVKVLLLCQQIGAAYLKHYKGQGLNIKPDINQLHVLTVIQYQPISILLQLVMHNRINLCIVYRMILIVYSIV